MCGITGVFQQPADRTISEMVRSISHRGPDGQGVMDVQNGILGHARLAILDVQGGHQLIDYRDFISERERLEKDWNCNLENSEVLYYYRILGEFYDDQSILPVIGHSRSL